MSIVKRILAVSLLFISATVFAESDNPRVTMTTSMGVIELELYPDKAPNTVANFLQYVDDGFYNGTIFHRIIDGFMIQAGGFTAEYVEKQTREPIENEADNKLSNTIGTIAMARTSDPHSATAQFYINVANNTNLDFREKTPRAWGYAVFGRVVQGMDVVEKLKGVPTTTKRFANGHSYRDVPYDTVLIEKVERVGATHEQAPEQNPEQTPETEETPS